MLFNVYFPNDIIKENICSQICACSVSYSRFSKPNLRQLRSALLDAVFDPGHHSVENLLLTSHVQLITRDDVNQLVGRKQHELFAFHHLRQEQKSIQDSVNPLSLVPLLLKSYLKSKLKYIGTVKCFVR